MPSKFSHAWVAANYEQHQNSFKSPASRSAETAIDPRSPPQTHDQTPTRSNTVSTSPPPSIAHVRDPSVASSTLSSSRPTSSVITAIYAPIAESRSQRPLRTSASSSRTPSSPPGRISSQPASAYHFSASSPSIQYPPTNKHKRHSSLQSSSSPSTYPSTTPPTTTSDLSRSASPVSEPTPDSEAEDPSLYSVESALPGPSGRPNPNATMPVEFVQPWNNPDITPRLFNKINDSVHQSTSSHESDDSVPPPIRRTPKFSESVDEEIGEKRAGKKSGGFWKGFGLGGGSGGGREASILSGTRKSTTSKELADRERATQQSIDHLTELISQSDQLDDLHRKMLEKKITKTKETLRNMEGVGIAPFL
ncbi:hypothetical protein MMC20_005508 [Loxospora ochrophaea]|nr:hypothetical protein [Loxospora ochrophaea]